MPTPDSYPRGGAVTPDKRGQGHQQNLQDTIKQLTSLEDLPDEGGQLALLPTPAVNDMGDNKTVEWWEEFCARTTAKHNNGVGHGDSLAIEAKRLFGNPPDDYEGLLPTPTRSDGTGDARAHKGGNPTLPGALFGPTERDREYFGLLPTPTKFDGTTEKTEQWGRPNLKGLLPTPQAMDGFPWSETPEEREAAGHQVLLAHQAKALEAWGKYAPAIARWALILGRPPAPPIEDPDTPQLSARFVEWLMGLPPGWVCDIPQEGEPNKVRRLRLQALGNGVVPLQAAAAIRLLIGRVLEEGQS